jgi:uncharacterized membrane-anchored protein
MKIKPLVLVGRAVEAVAILPITLLSLFVVMGIESLFKVPELELRHYLNLLFLIASLVGVISLWLAIITTNNFCKENPELVVFVLGGLVAGCLVAIVFLFVGVSALAQGEAHPRLWESFLIIGLPLLIGLRHMYRIWTAMRKKANPQLNRTRATTARAG